MSSSQAVQLEKTTLGRNLFIGTVVPSILLFRSSREALHSNAFSAWRTLDQSLQEVIEQVFRTNIFYWIQDEQCHLSGYKARITIWESNLVTRCPSRICLSFWRWIRTFGISLTTNRTYSENPGPCQQDHRSQLFILVFVSLHCYSASFMLPMYLTSLTLLSKKSDSHSATSSPSSCAAPVHSHTLQVL